VARRGKRLSIDDVPAAAARLHRGRNGLPREQVSDIQRARLLAATTELVARDGAGMVTVAHVVARAGMSRRTFYELFENREACFLAAFDEAVAHAAAVVVPAYGGVRGWREQVRAGLAALLWFLEDEPDAARLCVVEMLGAGQMALERRARVVGALVAAVDRGRGEARAGAPPPPLAAEGAVGAALALVHARITGQIPSVNGSRRRPRGRPAPLGDLLNPLMGTIVLPFLGPAAARRELAREPSRAVRAAAARPPRRPNPLAGVEMRLTYRTLRVLGAIAERPGASNRQVADASGISDQGQISKLLRRLEGLGLIRNDGAGQPSGEPNEWRLTDVGRKVEEALAVQAAPRTVAPRR